MKRLFLAAALLVAPCAMAIADSPATQPSVSVQDMQARIADLEAVNAALQRKIQQLIAENKALIKTVQSLKSPKPITSVASPTNSRPAIGLSETELNAYGIVHLDSESQNYKVFTVQNNSGFYRVTLSGGKVSNVSVIDEGPGTAGSYDPTTGMTN